MAKRDKLDIGLNQRLGEFEKRLFVLKIEYEKYFSGVSQIEPLRERDDLKRMMRDFQREPIRSTRQQYRLRQLRARFMSTEMYWTRNLVMIERGTHPRMKFRADLKDRERHGGNTGPKITRVPRETAADREDKAYQTVFDKYVSAREKCGQTTDMQFESVRDVLKKQVRTIKSRYRCTSVKFRVTVEDGKAKVKAVPVR